MSPALAGGFVTMDLQRSPEATLNWWHGSISACMVSAPNSNGRKVCGHLCLVPVRVSYLHWRGRSLMSFCLGAPWDWKEFNVKLLCVPTLLWAGETFLPQIHLVTLIFLWFNLVFIPKVGAHRMLPASQEYGRINEPLLGKLLELLRWNKQHHIFNTLDSVALFKMAFLSFTRQQLTFLQNRKWNPLPPPLPAPPPQQTSVTKLVFCLYNSVNVSRGGKNVPALEQLWKLDIPSHTYMLTHIHNSSANKMLLHLLSGDNFRVKFPRYKLRLRCLNAWAPCQQQVIASSRKDIWTFGCAPYRKAHPWCLWL